MKKLFFTALVAVVAIGGAFAQYQAQPESVNPTAPIFNCEGTDDPTCGSITVYYQNTNTQVPSSDPAYDLTYPN